MLQETEIGDFTVKMAGGVRVMQHKHETTKTNTKEDKEAEANAPV
jgi:hypothetical protein